MKKYMICKLLGGLLLLFLFACNEEETKYDSSVIRQFEIYLNGEPWSLNTGISTKPLFLYKEDGEYFANYSSHYRFSLENGNYKFVATDTPEELIYSPVNLNELVIPQFPHADHRINISAATEYDSPFNEVLQLHMQTRTGTLRLNATDEKADKSYSIVKAIVTAERSGYHVVDETYIEEPMELVRSKTTNSGGVNYTDDFILFRTGDESSGVSVLFEFLDQDSTIVKTRELAGSFGIFPDSVTTVEFHLNDEDAPVIQDYTVTVYADDWSSEELYPEIPVRVPDGYTYVSPADNIVSIYEEMAADESVDEIKLFLKAGAVYEIGRIRIAKPISILGQDPEDGETKAVLAMGNVSRISGDIGYIRYENLLLNVTDAYAFNFDLTSPFNVGEVSFKGCHIDNLSRALWRHDNHQSTQLVGNFIIDDCTFMNFAQGQRNYALINMADENTISRIQISNSTVEILASAFSGPVISSPRNQTGKDIEIDIHNTTFSCLGNPGINLFDFRADNANSLTLTMENNLFSGISDGEGTWVRLDNSAGTKTFSNNYRPSDFILRDWGVDPAFEPKATLSKEELFEDYTSGDLTIKARSSAVYLNHIGDPRWIK